MKESKIVFIFLTLIFLIIGSYLVLLTQGLVFDWKKGKFIKTGGIFLNSKPGDVILKIDQKSEFKNIKFNFLNGGILSNINGGVLIEKILPGIHLVEISKEGFQEWSKKVEVKEGLVTEFPEIILLPKEIPFEIKENNHLEDFFLTAKGIIKETGQEKEKIVLTNQKNTLIITQKNNQNKKNYFISDINETSSFLNISEIFQQLKQKDSNLKEKDEIEEIFFHPFSDSKLILKTQKAVYELDFKKPKLKPIFSSENEITHLLIKENEILILDNKNNLISYHLIFQILDQKSINFENLEIKKFAEKDSLFGFLSTKKDLFIFDFNQSHQPLKTFKNIENFFFLAKNLILLQKSQKFEVFDLKRNKSWQLKLPIKEIKEIENFFISNYYFLALTEKGLLLFEIYEGEPTNWYLLKEKVKKFYQHQNSLYLLKENQLFESKIKNWWQD